MWPQIPTMAVLQECSAHCLLVERMYLDMLPGMESSSLSIQMIVLGRKKESWWNKYFIFILLSQNPKPHGENWILLNLLDWKQACKFYKIPQCARTAAEEPCCAWRLVNTASAVSGLCCDWPLEILWKFHLLSCCFSLPFLCQLMPLQPSLSFQLSNALSREILSFRSDQSSTPLCKYKIYNNSI